MTKLLAKNTLSIWKWINDILTEQASLHIDLLYIVMKVRVIGDKNFIDGLLLPEVELFEQVLAQNNAKMLFLA